MDFIIYVSINNFLYATLILFDKSLGKKRFSVFLLERRLRACRKCLHFLREKKY